jgi:hypothetical protein
LWGTRPVRHERLLRTRCRDEVRKRHGLRLWVGRGNTGAKKSAC